MQYFTALLDFPSLQCRSVNESYNMGNRFKKPPNWGSTKWFLLAPFRLPQFAVEKYVGNLLNGEKSQNLANWGSTEISYTGKTPDC